MVFTLHFTLYSNHVKHFESSLGEGLRNWNCLTFTITTWMDFDMLIAQNNMASKKKRSWLECIFSCCCCCFFLQATSAGVPGKDQRSATRMCKSWSSNPNIPTARKRWYCEVYFMISPSSLLYSALGMCSEGESQLGDVMSASRQLRNMSSWLPSAGQLWHHIPEKTARYVLALCSLDYT